MGEEELRELLSQRLHIELQIFKDSILRQTKIYKSSYQIEIFVNAYEILLEDMEHLDGDMVRGLLRQDSGILDSLYQEWLAREDSVFEELKAYIGGGLGMIAKISSPACGKEDRDGTEPDKAAQGR